LADNATEGDVNVIIYNAIASTKMLEVQISEVDAIPAPLSLAQQWVKIVSVLST
jgi:hypothetical protein